MYDSTNVADDPLNAQLIGFYIDGIYATTAAAVRARFPNAVLVPISAIGTNNGIVGDVEPGCMTIAQSIDWVRMRRAAGLDPSLYVNETYGWAPCRAAFASAGVPEPHWWVADYDGIAVVPAGAIAKQYANPTLTGGHFDLSVVADFWPGVDGLAGGGSGQLGDEDLLFTGPTHPLATSLAAFTAGSYYAAPFTQAKVLGGVTAGAVYAVDGYVYSSSPAQSPDLSAAPGNQPGPDAPWWHVKTGGWIPDAILNTIGVANAPGPNWPAGESVTQLYDLASGRFIPLGVAAASTPDDDSAFATKADLAAAIAALPKTPSTGTIDGPITVKLS